MMLRALIVHFQRINGLQSLKLLQVEQSIQQFQNTDLSKNTEQLLPEYRFQYNYTAQASPKYRFEHKY